MDHFQLIDWCQQVVALEGVGGDTRRRRRATRGGDKLSRATNNKQQLTNCHQILATTLKMRPQIHLHNYHNHQDRHHNSGRRIKTISMQHRKQINTMKSVLSSLAIVLAAVLLCAGGGQQDNPADQLINLVSAEPRLLPIQATNTNSPQLQLMKQPQQQQQSSSSVVVDSAAERQNQLLKSANVELNRRNLQVRSHKREIISPPSAVATVGVGGGGGPAAPDADTPTCGYPGSPAHASVTFNTSQVVAGTAASYTCDNGYELLGPPRRICQANGTWSPIGIPFCVLNVGLGKAAMQSSTAGHGSAQKAVDGSTSPYFQASTCTMTDVEHNPWWYVNLLEPYLVQIVRIDFGTACCANRQKATIAVRVGNNRPDLGNNPLCNRYHGFIEEGKPLFLPCTRPAPGAFVSIHLEAPSGSSLSICETFIYTDHALSIEQCPSFRDLPLGSTATYNGKCYLFYNNHALNFDSARKYCESRGGSLVDETSPALQGFLSWELYRRHRNDQLMGQYWLGATRDPRQAQNWKWINGKDVQISFWNSLASAGNCSRFDGSKGWLWSDTDCQSSLNFICQYRPLSCGKPEKPTNSTLISKTVDNGTVIEYQCAPGNLLMGPRSRACLPTGFFSEFAPKCKYLDCQLPAMIPNGDYRLLNATTGYQSVVTYYCHEGHQLYGKSTLACDVDERWNGPPPRCEPLLCPAPVAPSNGYVTLTSNVTTPGTQANYECRPGYELVGERLLTCHQSGAWDNSFPYCRERRQIMPHLLHIGGQPMATNSAGNQMAAANAAGGPRPAQQQFPNGGQAPPTNNNNNGRPPLATTSGANRAPAPVQFPANGRVNGGAPSSTSTTTSLPPAGGSSSAAPSSPPSSSSPSTPVGTQSSLQPTPFSTTTSSQSPAASLNGLAGQMAISNGAGPQTATNNNPQQAAANEIASNQVPQPDNNIQQQQQQLQQQQSSRKPIGQQQQSEAALDNGRSQQLASPSSVPVPQLQAPPRQSTQLQLNSIAPSSSLATSGSSAGAVRGQTQGATANNNQQQQPKFVFTSTLPQATSTTQAASPSATYDSSPLATNSISVHSSSSSNQAMASLPTSAFTSGGSSSSSINSNPFQAPSSTTLGPLGSLGSTASASSPTLGQHNHMANHNQHQPAANSNNNLPISFASMPSKHNYPLSAKYSLDGIIAAAIFFGFVFLGTIITILVIIIRRRKSSQSSSIDAQTISTYDSQGEHNGLYRNYQQAWENLRFAGPNGQPKSSGNVASSGSGLITAHISGGPSMGMKNYASPGVALLHHNAQHLNPINAAATAAAAGGHHNLGMSSSSTSSSQTSSSLGGLGAPGSGGADPLLGSASGGHHHHRASAILHLKQQQHLANRHLIHQQHADELHNRRHNDLDHDHDDDDGDDDDDEQGVLSADETSNSVYPVAGGGHHNHNHHHHNHFRHHHNNNNQHHDHSHSHFNPAYSEGFRDTNELTVEADTALMATTVNNLQASARRRRLYSTSGSIGRRSMVGSVIGHQAAVAAAQTGANRRSVGNLMMPTSGGGLGMGLGLGLGGHIHQAPDGGRNYHHQVTNNNAHQHQRLVSTTSTSSNSTHSSRASPPSDDHSLDQLAYGTDWHHPTGSGSRDNGEQQQ